jgi:catechol-2,3-dioxygenase
MMTVNVVKLGFVGLHVADRDNMKRHFHEIIGLPVSEESPEGTYLACGNEQHAISLHPSAGRKGIRHFGLRIDRRVSLADALKGLTAAGLKAQRKSDVFPGIAETIEMTDPDGYTVFLYSDSAPAPAPYGAQGVGPFKLGHVALFVENSPKSAKYYTDVFGFRWSDWCEDLFVFMRCNADHHSLNLTNNARRGMFHVAFELRDFSHIGRACDILSANEVPIVWGPGRHGMGHNLFAYHRDPEGNTVEFMAEMDRMSDEGVGFFDPKPYHTEVPQRPKVWKFGPESSNVWGVMPPQGFMD